MLGIMRKYKQSFIIKGVFIIIVLSFIGTIFLIWGTGEEGLQGSGYAVKVNGEKIPYENYVRGYEQIKSSFQQMYGRPITPEIEKQMGLRKMVLDNLIGAALVQREAKRMGIKVSDEEVIADISKMPYFQKDGSFDKQLYEQMLKANRLTPGAFEDARRKELLMSKARKTITDGVKISDQDALTEFRKKNDRITLQFVSFSPAEVQKEVKVTEQELNDFLKQNEKKFRTKEEISVSFVRLSPESLAPKVSVTSEELQSFYQKNIDRYQGKEGILPFEEVKDRVKIQAVQFKTAKKAYEMAADALNKNLETADINSVARMLGTTVTETPFFTAQTPPESIAGEASIMLKGFLLKQGELGGPFETPKGVYILKVLSRKPSVVPPLAKVRSEVEKGVLAERSSDLARKKATEAQVRLAKAPLDGTMQETGSFQYTEKGEIPKIGASAELMEAAFRLSKASPAPSAPFLVQGRWYAVRLKERIETPIADFEKEKRKTIQALLPVKQQEAVEKWLAALKDKAKIVINPALTAE